jgi:hypothetical protein
MSDQQKSLYVISLSGDSRSIRYHICRAGRRLLYLSDIRARVASRSVTTAARIVARSIA